MYDGDNYSFTLVDSDQRTETYGPAYICNAADIDIFHEKYYALLSGDLNKCTDPTDEELAELAFSAQGTDGNEI